MVKRLPAIVYRLFRVPKGRAREVERLLKDDLVSRQSIEVRTADSLGVEGEGTIVLVEGSDAGIAKAETLLKGVAAVLPAPEASKAYARFRSQGDDAASGMGLVFGS